MSETTHEQFLGGVFDDYEAAENSFAELKATEPNTSSGSIEYREYELEVDKAEKNKNEIMTKSLRELVGYKRGERVIEALDIPDTHSAIAFNLIGLASYNRSFTEKKALVSEGIERIDRVISWLDRPGDIVNVGTGIYRSIGAEGVTVPKDRGKPEKIKAFIGKGISAGVNNIKEESFPDIRISRERVLAFDLFGDINPWPIRKLQQWDPEFDPETEVKAGNDKEGYEPPIRFLGNREEHEDGVTIETDSDASLFATRLAVQEMGEDDWINLENPSAEFADKLTEQYALVFAQVLRGSEPHDTREHISESFGSMTNRTHLRRQQLRSRGLADFAISDMLVIFKAAGTDLDKVIARTKRYAVTPTPLTSPKELLKSMKMESDIDDFFGQMKTLSS